MNEKISILINQKCLFINFLFISIVFSSEIFSVFKHVILVKNKVKLMLKLTLRAPSSIPLELDSILPERVAGVSPLEVAKLPVQFGNRPEALGR